MRSFITSFLRLAGNPAAASIFLAAILLPVSFTGGVVTTPAISHALGGSAAALAWLTNGFMLTFGSFLLSAGVMADAAGRKRVFILGLFIFALSSSLISVADNISLIGALRSLQGISAAMTLAGGSAALAQLYEGVARTRAFSILGTMFGAGLAFGPLALGFITDALGWRWVYALMALISGTVMLTGTLFIPVSEKSAHRVVDYAGLTLFTAALVLFTAGIMLVPVWGCLSLPGLALFATALLLFVAFMVRSLNVENPVFDLSLVRDPRFAGVLLLPVATCYCYVVLLIILPLHFMGGDGLSETQSAFYLMALTTPMLIVPSISALLTRWFNPGSVSVAGLMLSAAGLLILGQALQSTSSILLMFSLVLTGAGAALPWGLMDGLAISSVPVEKAGMAAGLFNTVRVAGEGIALAMVSAFLVEMNALNLRKNLSGYTSERIDSAASWLGSGNTERAAALLPGLSHQLLRESYDSAYVWLFRLLAVITVLCAFMVWRMPGWSRPVYTSLPSAVSRARRPR
ncbi:MFS transporter [Enterobacter cloacae]|uniref:MFS transporter n=1 Tax=Enterobacter cloacae TaxID=550 RepID=UPI00101B18B9|nr:MFS transporter [Enterobacter cloacae]QBC03813.1 MFS transporter [Enterobacter cloacae]